MRTRLITVNASGLSLVFFWFFLLVFDARAVIFYSTADPSYNTTAPTGTLAGSGWQWEGEWVGFTGTPIGSHHFLTAQHVGGSVGNVFNFRGQSYTTVAYFDDPSTDLRIWQVAEPFPDWAPIYRNSDESGKALVVFGRGLSRGAEVRVGTALKGWQWGANGGVLRWGQNTVSGYTDTVSLAASLLRVAFDATGGVNEAHMAVGDSAGGVFIEDTSGWKLAGVNYAVDAFFNTTNTGSGFNAAIFDAEGLYFGSQSSGWTYISSHLTSAFYATRVSLRQAWIDSIVPVETPGAGTDVPVNMPLVIAALTSGFLFFGIKRLEQLSRTQPPA